MNQEQEAEIREAVMIALGRASMCWVEIPTSSFDSNSAVEVGEDLLRKIGSILK